MKTAADLAIHACMIAVGVLLLDFGPLERCAEEDCWATWLYEFGPLFSFVLLPLGLLGLVRLVLDHRQRER